MYICIHIYVTLKSNAGVIFIHPATSYFKIPETDVQKSSPPIPHSRRLADVVPIRILNLSAREPYLIFPPSVQSGLSHLPRAEEFKSGL